MTSPSPVPVFLAALTRRSAPSRISAAIGYLGMMAVAAIRYAFAASLERDDVDDG